MSMETIKNRRGLIKLLLLVSSISLCCGESFLAPEKRRKPSAMQLKQEIVETMALLVEEESRAIERRAQIQQVLAKLIRAYTENSPLKGDRAEMLVRLQKERERYIREYALEGQFFRFLTTIL